VRKGVRKGVREGVREGGSEGVLKASHQKDQMERACKEIF
jgi:DNA gyrase inhibitor GyrI